MLRLALHSHGAGHPELAHFTHFKQHGQPSRVSGQTPIANAEVGLVHVPHLAQRSCLAPVGMTQGFADLPQLKTLSSEDLRTMVVIESAAAEGSSGNDP